MRSVRGYWRWLGQRLRLSRAGRVVFTVAFLVCVAGFVDARVHGDGEGGAPLVVLAMVLTGVVALDALARGFVSGVRRVIGGQRR